MDFRFDAHQDYQLEAIRAVSDLFEGLAPQRQDDFSFEFGAGLAAVSNQLDSDDTQLLPNLQAVQRSNDIEPDGQLETIDEVIETPDGGTEVSFPNFSVEMETGTGKTYVYLRTALELHDRYGLRKFIVVVPSRAIREGVLKDLNMTREHFRELYDNVPYRWYRYNSENLSQVRQFALSNSIEFMVMTLDSFNRASNIIHRTTDRLQGETPIHLVQATRPILILDEPQNMETDLAIKSIATLNPLLTLRYSATHRNPYNLIYRLTPHDAYRRGLVKRIEVASVLTRDDLARPYIRLEGVNTSGNRVTARLNVHKLRSSGTVAERAVTVQPNDDLQAITAREVYAGYLIDEINPGGGFIRFSNATELRVGETVGEDRESLFRAQVGYTIEEHMRKQARLAPHGIKVLSLFFIDRVANYVGDKPIIKEQFDEVFRELRSRYEGWEDREPADVRAGYFAYTRNRRTDEVTYYDSSTGDSQRDLSAYDLILKNKDRLLGFDEPVSFIFSHSALREGWDNPNVFQICTLNQAASDMRKRQEIGRGVRLPRDQEGERIQDESINVLTVIANETYENYVTGLQSEVEEDYGTGEGPPPPEDARKRRTAGLRKQRTLTPEFKELWERIKHKTRYSVTIDTDRLVEDVAAALSHATIPEPRVEITKAQVRVGEKDVYQAMQVSAAKAVSHLAGRYPLPNLVDVMAHQLRSSTPPTYLTRRTLLRIFEMAENQGDAIRNPTAYASTAVGIIRHFLSKQLVDGIQYEKLNDWYEMTQFETSIQSWSQYLEPSLQGVYDHVVVDSEVERHFVQDLDLREDVKLYVKLPGWFKVPSPLGSYNPDWAVVMEQRDEYGQPTGQEDLYLVRETKSTTDEAELGEKERAKVQCGRAHFEGALAVDYRVVSEASQLP